MNPTEATTAIQTGQAGVLSIEVPIIPYLSKDRIKDLYYLLPAYMFSAQQNGSGKVLGKEFRRWLKDQGYSNPSRNWKAIKESGLGQYNSRHGLFYLSSLHRKVTPKLVDEALKSAPNNAHTKFGYSNIFTSRIGLVQLKSLPAFRKWWTQQIASRPKYKQTKDTSLAPSKRNDVRKPFYAGRSVSQIAEEACIEKRTAINHLKRLEKVRQAERHHKKLDAEAQASVQLEAIRNSQYLCRLDKDGFTINLWNSYKPNSLFRWRILLTNSGGRLVCRKRVSFRPNGIYSIETRIESTRVIDVHSTQERL